MFAFMKTMSAAHLNIAADLKKKDNTFRPKNSGRVLYFYSVFAIFDLLI